VENTPTHVGHNLLGDLTHNAFSSDVLEDARAAGRQDRKGRLRISWAALLFSAATERRQLSARTAPE